MQPSIPGGNSSLAVKRFCSRPRAHFSSSLPQCGLRMLRHRVPLFLALLALFLPEVLHVQASERATLKNYQHVFVIMMENTSYTSLIGNANAPFINSAAATFGLATNYDGVAHPSQPNYIAATSGSTNTVVDDNDITIDVTNVVDQLETHRKTWKAYMQSLSLCDGDLLAHSCGNQLYERKHNPFVSYLDVQTNPSRLANIVDFAQFSTDLANNAVPNFVWIALISATTCTDAPASRATPATFPMNNSSSRRGTHS